MNMKLKEMCYPKGFFLGVAPFFKTTSIVKRAFVKALRDATFDDCKESLRTANNILSSDRVELTSLGTELHMLLAYADKPLTPVQEYLNL